MANARAFVQGISAPVPFTWSEDSQVRARSSGASGMVSAGVAIVDACGECARVRVAISAPVPFTWC
ncbi:hypothetical protein, partial [Rhodococcus sp. AW25M09]|uniref:hypothetical protein n=1 Tax=Rhodococcus sp. AW25M09 TaxID=1268303 RepID=UPI001E35FBD3